MPQVNGEKPISAMLVTICGNIEKTAASVKVAAVLTSEILACSSFVTGGQYEF